MNLFFISIFIFCISINSFGQKQSKKEQVRLRYDGIYVNDNGIDTIIKDYKSFMEMKEQGIFDRYNIVQKDTFFINSKDSKTTTYLKFNKYGKCSFYSNHDDINVEKGYNRIVRIEKEEPDDMRKYYLMDNNKIFFDIGTSERFIMYNGTMKKDTIIFKLSINGVEGYPYRDSVKVFTFYKYP